MRDITKDHEFIEILVDHALEILDYLIEEQVGFSILCKLHDTEFEPELPAVMMQNFRPLTLFSIEQYTLETAELDILEAILRFEAGFGEENFGSVVTVPVASILQILVGETVIFVNTTVSHLPKKKIKSKTEGATEKSLKSFLNNPENRKFFKED